MWKSIVADSHLQSQYGYIRKVRTKLSGGKYRLEPTAYGGLMLKFIPMSKGVDYGTDGNKVAQLSTAVVTEKFFTDNGIVPELDDFITGEEDVQWRVIGIEDYTFMRHAGIYYLHLRRDELAY